MAVSVCDPVVDPVEEDEEEEDPFLRQMNRGAYLRKLRLLALADEEERSRRSRSDSIGRIASCASVVDLFQGCEEDKLEADGGNEGRLEDRVRTVPGTRDTVLDYGSYLSHQRYHDDLKHVDHRYIDFGRMLNFRGDDCGGLIVEQRKRLGKGGFCWDAGFVLGEHVIAEEGAWNPPSSRGGRGGGPPRVVELGAGTGLCGMMVAKAVDCRVEVTDLPELAGLMADNVHRNFATGDDDADGPEDGPEDEPADEPAMLTARDGKARGKITSRVLRWGAEGDYPATPYDAILGADIVTSLYDPAALARTLHALSGPRTRIYLSGKARLDRPHEEFDREMRRRFGTVRRAAPRSRLRSPGIFVIVAGDRR